MAESSSALRTSSRRQAGRIVADERIKTAGKTPLLGTCTAGAEMVPIKEGVSSVKKTGLVRDCTKAFDSWVHLKEHLVLVKPEITRLEPNKGLWLSNTCSFTCSFVVTWASQPCGLQGGRKDSLGTGCGNTAAAECSQERSELD